MAEALAVVGLVSAIVQFVDFSTKIVHRLHEFQAEVANGPKVYQDVQTRLPLMLDLVNKIRVRVAVGQIDRSSQVTMLPIIESCISQVNLLNNLLLKALPQASDSSWTRGKRAFHSVIQEPEMEKIDLVLRTNFELLVQAETIHRLEIGGAKSDQTVNVFMPPQQQNATISPPQNSHERLRSISSRYVFMVPFQRDPKFLGRKNVIEDLVQKFQDQRQVALAGLGGVGKSQIAIEYCYIYRDENPKAHVFWIYAGTKAKFEQGYQEIARRLSLTGWDDQKVDTLQLVYEWLSNEYNDEWLLVVDNADDEAAFFAKKSGQSVQEQGVSKPLARYLPKSTKGSVLVTTRDKRVGQRLAGREKAIEVLPMTAHDSKSLLQSRIAEEDWDDDDAMRLVEELTYLPLAITQAAAFISENGITISEYLELLGTNETELKDLLSEHLEDPRRDLDTENSVMRTWKLSFDQISKGKPRAAELLSLMAVLDHHGAPRMLLRKDGETETGFLTALGALQAFSLITTGRGKDAACKMHRLVALSTQKWLELRGMLRHWQTTALKVLSENFPGRQSYENWALLEALTPHAQLVFSFTFHTAMDLLQCAALLDFAALYDLGKGRYEEAHDKCIKSLQIRENILPADDPLTLESVQTLGETLLHLGKLDSARGMLQRAIAGREKALGAEHPDTLESISDLTITLLELDDVSAAEETALRALRGREKVLGLDDPDTLVSLNILAMLRQRQGNLVVAREECERALRGREKILGREHPDTLMTLNNWAMLHYRQGNFNTAKEILQIVLAGEEKLLGPEGYDIQVSLSNMGLVLSGQGDLDAAEAIHSRVIAIREKMLGPEHPATLMSVKTLAAVLSQKGDTVRAEKMHARIHKSERKPEAAGALLRAGLLFD